MKMGKHDLLPLDEDGRIRAKRVPRGPSPKQLERRRQQAERAAKFARLCARYGHLPDTVRSRMRDRNGRKGLTLRQALRKPLAKAGGANRKSLRWAKDARLQYEGLRR